MSECNYYARCLHKIGMCNGNLPPCAAEAVEAAKTNIQQLKAEIRAICIELECTTYEKFDSGMYHALRGMLRELSAI